MTEVKEGKFYVYRDEDGNAVAVALMTRGPNGGHIGVDYARMGVPYGKTTWEDINNRADFMIAAMNTFGNTRAALAAKDAELSILSAQNEWLKDRLSDLQLPAKSQKNIEEWLAECGMPTAEVSK